MMNKRQLSIETEIANIKQALMGVGQMHPGSLSQQSRAAGNTYYQLSYTHQGKGHTKYIRPEDVAEVRLKIENYRRFRSLVTKWVELAIELARLRRNRGKSNRRATGKEQRHAR